MIALWVQEWAVRLRRLGCSFEDIASELSKAGSGEGTMIGSGANTRRLVDPCRQRDVSAHKFSACRAQGFSPRPPLGGTA